tara:strand:- start:319 stop:696 length:378 start_codon:yes stop_codon:yes gene_type:complete
MRQFRNNNKRSRFRSNGDKSFKRNGQNNSFIEGQNFQRKSPGRNNQNANKLIEKYSDLAREALSNGDKILSENYFQHADHFLRILNDKDKNFTKDISEIQNQDKNIEISENKKTIDQNQDSENIV